MSAIAARLERLPFSRFHFNLLCIGGLGFAFEAVDAAIIAFLMPVLRNLWHLSSVETGILGSSTYVGFLIGALLAGLLGDRFGRRGVMMSALVLFCLASLASAFVNDWQVFLWCRIIGGIGMGAEGAIVAPFLSEFVATRYRGAFTGALAGFFSFGFVAAALLGYFVIPVSDDGWRITLVLLALPVVVLLWWRRALVESPRWLESRGRNAEAEAIVSRIEAAVVSYGHVLPPVIESSHGAVQMLAGSICLSFFMNGVNAGKYAYTPEVFPTNVRATGMGTASAVGRIGAISSPILVGYIFPIGGFVGVFGMTTVVLAVGALSVLLLGVPTKGLSLETIAERELGSVGDQVQPVHG